MKRIIQHNRFILVLLAINLGLISCEDTKILFEANPKQICSSDVVKIEWDLTSTQNHNITSFPLNQEINNSILTSKKGSIDVAITENTTITLTFPNGEKIEKFINIVEGDETEELDFFWSCDNSIGSYNNNNLIPFFGKGLKITTIQNRTNREISLNINGRQANISAGGFSSAYNGQSLASKYSASLNLRPVEGCTQNDTLGNVIQKTPPQNILIKVAYSCSN